VGDERDERWTIGAYSQAQIGEMGRGGKPLLYSIERFVVAIPQCELINELEDKTLGLGPGGLMVLDRGPGI
jgi:hypothetical protein